MPTNDQCLDNYPSTFWATGDESPCSLSISIFEIDSFSPDQFTRTGQYLENYLNKRGCSKDKGQVVEEWKSVVEEVNNHRKDIHDNNNMEPVITHSKIIWWLFLLLR